MSTTRKGQSTSHYEHTPHLQARRRSLFPADIIDSEEDSDLGHISPLSFESDNEDLNYLVPTQESNNGYLSSKMDSIGDYDILGVVENMQGPVCTPVTKTNYPHLETMSPLYLSPYCSRLDSVPENTILNETPFKMSPSYNLKTPHDASNTNSKVPKLVRKSLLDTLENTSVKRKLSPLNSPEQNKNKNLKLDPKNSKVRTTLFPEVDISLPTKSFYPRTVNIMEKLTKRETFLKSSVPCSTSRKAKSRKKIGQINAGVSHKIRKPKQRKVKKSLLVKAAINAVNHSAINDYIKDLKELNSTKNEQIKLIENKENTNPKLIEQQQVITPKLIDANVCRRTTNALEIDSNKKRARSPVSEPDPNKKFFKFSRTRGIVTVNKNMKIQIDNGKMSILEKENKYKKIPKIQFDYSDLTVDEPFLPKSNIESILSSLSNDDNKVETTQNGTKIVLRAHSSVSASENSILLHTQPTTCNANLILSPISQMCDVTSGLALNSPKKVKNLTSILNEMPNASSNIFNKDISTVTEKQKLFPVFCARNNIPEKKDNKVVTRTIKKFKNIEENQMLLDAGQKRFGITQCAECSFLYHIGDPSDENMHSQYHNAGHILKFAGWKNERVVANLSNNGRIIQILPEDSKIWWKKAKELMDVINRELGCFEMEFSLDHCQVFLYIKSRMIAGCAVAVPKTEGHKMLTTKQTGPDLCSEETYPIKCGIPRIWVSHNYRKQGIATALMNTIKKNFMFGYILNNSDIALSGPTDMGKCFAKSYFKSPNYLIYYR